MTLNGALVTVCRPLASSSVTSRMRDCPGGMQLLVQHLQTVYYSPKPRVALTTQVRTLPVTSPKSTRGIGWMGLV
jgi:hypothetical protein